MNSQTIGRNERTQTWNCLDPRSRPDKPFLRNRSLIPLRLWNFSFYSFTSIFFVFMSDIFIDLFLLTTFNLIFLRNLQCKFFFSMFCRQFKQFCNDYRVVCVFEKKFNFEEQIEKWKQNNCPQLLSCEILLGCQVKTKKYRNWPKNCFSYKGIKFRTFSLVSGPRLNSNFVSYLWEIRTTQYLTKASGEL